MSYNNKFICFAVMILCGCTTEYSNQIKASLLEPIERTDKFVITRSNNWRLNPGAKIYVSSVSYLLQNDQDNGRLNSQFEYIAQSYLQKAFSEVVFLEIGKWARW